MMNRNHPQELESALVRAGRTIAYPPTPSMVVRVRKQSSGEPSRARPSFVLVRLSIALGLVIALALLTFPETRDSLGQLFGLSNASVSTFTPTLAMTAQPNPSISTTMTSAATPQATRPGTPSTLCSNCDTNVVDIRLLAKPIAKPNEFTSNK